MSDETLETRIARMEGKLDILLDLDSKLQPRVRRLEVGYGVGAAAAVIFGLVVTLLELQALR